MKNTKEIAHQIVSLCKKDKEEAVKKERERIASVIENGLADIWATTIAPNGAFRDGSQEQFYADRMYKLQQLIAGIGQSLKQQALSEAKEGEQGWIR